MSLLGITPHHDFFDIEDIPTRPLMFFLFWRLDFSLVSLAPVWIGLAHLVHLVCILSCLLLPPLVSYSSCLLYYYLVLYFICSVL